jgi:predicted nucleic acid-binding protein
LRLYLDTSALVKRYVEEEGSATVREAIARAETVATAVIAYVEACAAFARRRREGTLSRGDYRRTIQELQSDWEHYLLLEVTNELIRRAADLAAIYPLRAYDTMHLAFAKALHERLQGPIFFAGWDSNLSAVAKREGLTSVPIK